MPNTTGRVWLCGYPIQTERTRRCTGNLTLPFDLGHYQQRHRELRVLLDALTPDVESQALQDTLAAIRHGGVWERRAATATREFTPPPPHNYR